MNCICIKRNQIVIFVLDHSKQETTKIIAVNTAESNPNTSSSTEPHEPSTSQSKDYAAQPIAAGSSKTDFMKRYLLRENVTRAEIIWALETISSHSSFRTASSEAALFRLMFPDSEIASKIQLSRTKVSYLITYGIAPYFSNDLFHLLKNCTNLVVEFDETLNKISQKQQMDISARYWNENKGLVESRYVGSAFLSSTRATDLIAGLKKCFEEDPSSLKKIIQISMDGPNVNWRVMKNFSEEIREMRGSPDYDLINIGSCGLHVVHNSFKEGMKKAGWKIDEFLQYLYSLFKNVPLRRAEYTAITGSSMFPLKFCGVRWVENQRVAERASNMLPYLKIYVAAVKKQKERKYKDTHPEFYRSFAAVSTASTFSVVTEAVEDKMLGAKLTFFMSSAAAIEPFLKSFQSDEPMVSFLFTELTNLIKPVMDKSIKPELFKVNLKSLISVDLSDDSFLPVAKIELSLAVKALVKSAAEKKIVSEKNLLIFRQNCKDFYVAFLRKMQQRSPLAYPITRYVSCLDPAVISKSPEIAKRRLNFCLEQLVEKDNISGTVADKVKVEYYELCDAVISTEILKNYRRSGNVWTDCG